MQKNKRFSRLQNSPYFCVFMYARAVKQKVWNEAENRERDWGETLKIRFFSLAHTPYGRVRLARFARVRLLRHALPISLLILRKKTTVLQSKDSQVFFFCKRTNNIHKFEVCFLRGEVTSNGFKIFNDCIVEPWILLVRLQKNLRIFCFQKTLWLDNLLPSVLVWASAL